MAQRNVAGRLGTAQQMRQTLRTVQAAQAVGQVDPVPRLLDLVVGQAALQLAFEDAAGVVGAELGQGADLDDVLHAGAQAGLDGRHFAAFQQIAEARLGRFDGRLVELAALEQVDVLPADRRQFVVEILPAMQVPGQQEAAASSIGSSMARMTTAYVMARMSSCSLASVSEASGVRIALPHDLSNRRLFARTCPSP